MSKSWLGDLTPEFWLMVLADFLAERTPRSRSLDLNECKRVAHEYVAAYPDALPRAINAADGCIERVVDLLAPPYLEWARQTLPDLLSEPPGMYGC